jgi:hypothetical protein
MPNVTNIHNIKNYNNYHFEIKNPSGNSMPFIPEDSRSLDRIINNAANQASGGGSNGNFNKQDS